MLRQHRDNNGKGKAQVLVEYTMVIGAVVMALMAMNVMIKRGVQGMIKVVADQVGNQEAAEQRFDDSGHMERSYSSMRTNADKTRTEEGGNLAYRYDDVTVTESETVSNLGFTETY